jgi:hypothetical protein
MTFSGEQCKMKLMNKKSFTSPKATMLLSSSCAFCPSVLDSLSKMIKSGELSSLEVINLEQNPDAMQKYNVRSVPWVRIGIHELTGSQTLEAFQQRAKWAMDEDKLTDNIAADFDFLLSDGQVNKVIEAIQKDNSKLQSVMDLLGDTGTVLSTRIGIGVVFEEFAGSDLLKSLIPELGKLSKHKDSRIRADTFHYLGMTADKSAIPFLEAGKKESNNTNDLEIKEIIEDSLESLTEFS